LGALGRCSSRSWIFAKRLQTPYSDDVFVESYVRLIRELGHFPALREMKLKRRQDFSFPRSGAFNRFGTKTAAAKRVLEFCRSNNGYEDVIRICEAAAEETAQRHDRIPPAASTEGLYI
jgi:hypothetical protein